MGTFARLVIAVGFAGATLAAPAAATPHWRDGVRDRGCQFTSRSQPHSRGPGSYGGYHGDSRGHHYAPRQYVPPPPPWGYMAPPRHYYETRPPRRHFTPRYRDRRYYEPYDGYRRHWR